MELKLFYVVIGYDSEDEPIYSGVEILADSEELAYFITLFTDIEVIELHYYKDERY